MTLANSPKGAQEFGLPFDDKDTEVIGLMSDGDTILRARYISTGLINWPDIAALDRTCKSLRRSVHEKFKGKKIFVRLNWP